LHKSIHFIQFQFHLTESPKRNLSRFQFFEEKKHHLMLVKVFII